jgi:predicted alpha/beta-hydrolase family hydrolase
MTPATAAPAATVVDIDTPSGLARAHVYKPKGAAVAALVLGHGAGGGVDAPDLVAVTGLATSKGWIVVLTEQPYRVAGRRSPAPAAKLDAAWVCVLEQLRATQLKGLDVVVTGGRSSGARVACRTAGDVGAAGVLCLAFPLQPAARAGKPPAPSRLPELDSVKVPVLIVQGDRDMFGMPPKAHTRTVAVVKGDHGLKRDMPAVLDAVDGWLDQLA